MLAKCVSRLLRQSLTVALLICLPGSLVSSLSAQTLPSDSERRDGRNLDDTGGYIHLAPGVIHTNNGCSQFSVSIVATLTNARVFGLRFFFDQTNLDLVSFSPGTDPRLNLLPYQLVSDTFRLDGFFHPNFPGGSVTLATLTCAAIAPEDTTALIGFLDGQGYSGESEWPEPIVFTGDTATVMIDGTAPLPPDSLIIIPLPYPSHDDSVRLQWKRVTRDLHGNEVVNPLYTVYMYDVLNHTPYTVGSILDTFIYDQFIHISFPCTSVVNIGLYEVRACKTHP